MIRLGLTIGGRPTVILGLTPANLARMAAGQPAQVNLRDLDPDGPPTPLPSVDVVICDASTADWRRGLAHLGLDDVEAIDEPDPLLVRPADGSEVCGLCTGPRPLPGRWRVGDLLSCTDHLGRAALEVAGV